MKRQNLSGTLKSPGLKRSRLSQRSKSDSGLSGILAKCGFVLTSCDLSDERIEPNQLNCDQALFVQKLKSFLKHDDRYPVVLDHFIDEFKQYLDSDSKYIKLRKSLTFSLYQSSDEVSSQKQASLVCNLLKIEDIQIKVMNLLCEKYMELVSLDSEAQNIARLLISQLRWMDTLVNPDDFCNQIIELLQVSPRHMQGEVITLLPDVIPEQHHNQVINVLKELYEESEELTNVILDTFIDLQLPQDVMMEIQESVLKHLPGAELNNQPVIMKFLLSTSNNDLKLMEDLRLNLDLASSGGSSTTAVGNTDSPQQYLTLEALKSALNLRKGLCDAMLKVYNNLKGHDRFKPLDLLFLLVLHTIPNKSKAVVTLMKNKLSAGDMTVTIVSKTFKLYGNVLQMYSKEILSLSESLLSSNSAVGVELAGELFKLNFLNSDKVWQQQILGSLLTILGISCQDNKTNIALSILAFLVHNHRETIIPYCAFFSILLDFIQNFTLPQLRLVLDILSIMAYSNQAASVMHNDFEILIDKHLANSNLYYKKIGVLSALMAVKSIGLISCVEDTDPEDSLEAATRLMDRTYQATWGLPTVQGLFLDQLSLLVNNNHILREIRYEIGEILTNNFQDDFIVDFEEVCDNMDEIQLSAQFGLDSNDSGGIALNLFPVLHRALGPEAENQNRMVDPVYLASYLKFLVAFETSKNNTNLEEIDALLGCPVVLPTDTFYQDFPSLSKKEKNLLFLSLFFTVNWFRECVNGFCKQGDKEMIAKVLRRLQNVVSIQNRLGKLMEKFENVKIPSVVFDLDSERINSDKCMSARAEVADDTIAGPSQRVKSLMTTKKPKKVAKGTQSGVSQAKVKKDKQPAHKDIKFHIAYRHCLREFTMDVFILLKNKIHLPSDTNGRCTSTGSAKLTVETLSALLEDLHAKLKFSLRSGFRRSVEHNPAGFCLLSLFEDSKVVELVLSFVTSLCVHLEDISRYIHEMDQQDLSQTSLEEMNEIEVSVYCYKLLLQIFNLLLSWTGFQQHNNKSLFTDFLKLIAGRIQSEISQGTTQQQLSRYVFKYFLKCSQEFHIPNIECASLNLKLLENVHSLRELKSLKLEISNVAKKYLNDSWDRMDSNMTNTVFNSSLEAILRAYLNYSPEEGKSLEDIVDVFLKVVQGGQEEDQQCYETLRKSTYHVYYKCVCECLVVSVSGLGSESHTRHSKLAKWQQAISLFQRLVQYIRSSESRLSLGVALKQGHSFVESFIKLGMPVCDQLFRTDGPEVQKLIKSLQVSTRFLQHICNHSKVKKDVSLTTYVPTLRKTLESFVFRVKAMLAANDCTEAFWLGNLKNRTLRGEEILSQHPQEEEQEGEDPGDANENDSVSY